MDLNGSVPSVMPLTNLTGGENLAVNGAPNTALLEEINEKKARIASLEAQLSSAQNAQKEIEADLNKSKGYLNTAELRIKELEELLAKASEDSGSGSESIMSDPALKQEIATLTKERDEYRDRLREFEIISDDLANLKRLQQENEQLKRSLAAQGGAAPTAEAPAPKAIDPDNILTQADVSDLLEDLGQTDSGSDDNKALEEFLSSPDEVDTSEADMLAAMNEAKEEAKEEKSGSDKTSEDLLSEFEKMLG